MYSTYPYKLVLKLFKYSCLKILIIKVGLIDFLFFCRILHAHPPHIFTAHSENSSHEKWALIEKFLFWYISFPFSNDESNGIGNNKSQKWNVKSPIFHARVESERENIKLLIFNAFKSSINEKRKQKKRRKKTWK